jgi:hypothetical protein
MTLPLTIVSRVHEYAGGDAWIGRISGPHPKNGLNRVPIGYQRRLTRGGRSGTVSFKIERAGVYELIKVRLRRDGVWAPWSGFIRVDHTGSWKVLGDATMAHSEVLESVRLQRECAAVLAELDDQLLRQAINDQIAADCHVQGEREESYQNDGIQREDYDR